MSKHLDLLRAHRDRLGAHNVNVNVLHDEFKISLGLNGRVAAVLTGVYGSMWFVYFLILGTTVWMFWQSFIDHKPFDPYPFAFLLFMGNLIQLIGGPIIQVGQNQSSTHSELRAESDYHVNRESFAKLEEIDNKIVTILERLEQRPARRKKAEVQG